MEMGFLYYGIINSKWETALVAKILYQMQNFLVSHSLANVIRVKVKTICTKQVSIMNNLLQK